MEKMYDAIEESRGEVKDVVYKELIESFAQIKKIKERGTYKVHFLGTRVSGTSSYPDEADIHIKVIPNRTCKIILGGKPHDPTMTFEDYLNRWIGFECDITEQGEIKGSQLRKTMMDFKLKNGRKKWDLEMRIDHAPQILYKWEKMN